MMNLAWPVQDPFGGRGRLVLNEYEKRTWIVLDENGHLQEQCTEIYTGPMLEQNKIDLNESQGKRWGDGRRVASIPLPIWWRTIKPARDNGDEKWIRKFLNDPDNSQFRTFGGRV